MPTLRNRRHERFAQELAAGKTADAAYVLAGYRAAITVETLIAEAAAARSKAMAERGGADAAVAAITAKES